MHSIYFKNFLATAGMVLVSFLLLAAAFISIGRSIFVDSARESMEANAQEIAVTASAYAADRDLQSLDLRMTLSSLASATGRHIFITSPTGYVVTCSDRQHFNQYIGRRVDLSLMQILYDEGSLTLLGDLNGFYDSEHFVVALPITYSGSSIAGYVFVSQESAEALYAWKTVLPMFMLLCLAVLCIAFILAYLFSRRLAQPLKDMADAARRFGHGDLSVRVAVTERNDELRDLTEAFNSMADSVEKSEEQRREFVANVSHELKTPMTTISGFADGILDGTIPPQNQKKYLQIISSETKRLSRLVRSMLELSRLQADGDRSALLEKSFDISEVLRLTLISFVDKIEERDLDVDFEVPESAVYVLGDSDAITQVVYNLLDNALKFASPGTTLGISLWKDSVKAYVSVRNTGPTIPEAEIPLLFERFHKSDRSRSRDRDGVGLGLYIVKTILNNHGEDIAVTSRSGVTDFVFTLTLK